MMQDALAGSDGLIVQYLAHYFRKGDGQGVRLGMAQAGGKAGLGIAINNQHLFSGLGKSHAEIHTTGSFSHTVLLIDQSDDLGVHGSRPPSKINDSIRKNFVNGEASSPPLLGKKKGRSIAGTPSKSKGDIRFLM